LKYIRLIEQGLESSCWFPGENKKSSVWDKLAGSVNLDFAKVFSCTADQ